MSDLPESWMHTLQPNLTFDGFKQSFVILEPDGQTPISLNLLDISLLQASLLGQGIVYGIQAGISALLFLILLVMTKPDKRRSLVFILNSLGLVFILARSIVHCVELGGPFYNFYIWDLAWYPYVEEINYYLRLSVFAEVLGLSIDCFIFSSLALQVHIICCTLSRFRHKIVMAFCFLLALTVCAVRLSIAVMNCEWQIMGIRTATTEQFLLISKVVTIYNYLAIACIAVFSAIFNTKLIFAILARRKLNMKQFGPMQIIFVMGLQTMIVPLILGIILYVTIPGSELQSFVDTSVAVLLPLSSMWASASVTNAAESKARDHRALPVGVFENSGWHGGRGAGDSGKRLNSNGTDSSTLIDDSDLEKAQFASVSTPTNTFGMDSVDFANGPNRHLNNLELGGIRVDRTYQVRLE